MMILHQEHVLGSRWKIFRGLILLGVCISNLVFAILVPEYLDTQLLFRFVFNALVLRFQIECAFLDYR